MIRIGGLDRTMPIRKWWIGAQIKAAALLKPQA
jgi:hypothetical protein